MTRCALYCRVSTSRQAEKELSIIDQQRHAKDYCKKNGWELVKEFVEPGASATNDQRPVFQQLMAFACSPDKPVDAVLIHSFSRFYRDNFELEKYRRALQAFDVELISMTQQISDDPQGDFMRLVLTGADGYNSSENAKHTSRAMRENARQGFWNGGKPPFGYKTTEAERRGDCIKKKLIINEDEAPLVRKIFDLYINGDGTNGRMGVKSIVKYLNDRGILRRGRQFYISNVNDMLKRSIYIGTHYFNRTDSKSGKVKPRDEWIPIEVPPIIEQDMFDKVQKTLEANSPKNTAPRLVNGPTLLSGLLKCGTCGGSMVLRTGKGGQYRYYACSTSASKGKTACPGRSIRMDFMDETILKELTQKLFTLERLYIVLHEIMDQSKSGKKALIEKLSELEKEHSAREQALTRLYAAIEAGTIDLEDPTLKERITKIKTHRDELAEQVALLSRQVSNDDLAITPKKLETFATLMRENLSDKNQALQKAYLNMFVKKIVLRDDEITITGSEFALAHGASSANKKGTIKVPSFDRDWHALREYNNHYISIT